MASDDRRPPTGSEPPVPEEVDLFDSLGDSDALEELLRDLPGQEERPASAAPEADAADESAEPAEDAPDATFDTPEEALEKFRAGGGRKKKERQERTKKIPPVLRRDSFLSLILK